MTPSNSSHRYQGDLTPECRLNRGHPNVRLPWNTTNTVPGTPPELTPGRHTMPPETTNTLSLDDNGPGPVLNAAQQTHSNRLTKVSGLHHPKRHHTSPRIRHRTPQVYPSGAWASIPMQCKTRRTSPPTHTVFQVSHQAHHFMTAPRPQPNPTSPPSPTPSSQAY